MISGRCFKADCYNKIVGKCECEGNVLFCSEHLPEHFQKKTSKGHVWVSSYIKPANDIKDPIIEKLTELKKDIKAYRNKAIADSGEVFKNYKANFGKYIDQINFIDKRCSNLIDILHRGEEVLDISGENDMESVLKLSAQNIQLKMLGWDISLCIFSVLLKI